MDGPLMNSVAHILRSGLRHCALSAVSGAILGTAAAAQELPPLDLPVMCDIGRLCVIQNYYDGDPGPGARDYDCGDLTYDGHRGTDFRVPDLAAMADGVPVVAAAAGRVLRIRDGVRDIDAREVDRATIEGREAGNAVVIDHGDGWETQYSHLRQGSVTVAPGDRVEAGQTLGLIGMSGLAEFPHVHFEARLANRAVDPFIGLDPPAGCGPGLSPLWSTAALEALGYAGGGLLSQGFADAVPDFAAIRRGDLRARELPRDTPALVFWVNLYGVREGDVFEAKLVAPDGSIVADRQETFERRQAQWYGYLGRRRRDDKWPAGVYRGEFRLLRSSGESLQLVADGNDEVILN